MKSHTHIHFHFGMLTPLELFNILEPKRCEKIAKNHWLLCLYATEAEKGQSKNILQIQKNILNRNIFLKSLSKSLTNLKNYCKS